MKTSSGFAIRSMRMSGLALASLVSGVGSLMAADVNLTASGAYFASGAGWSNAAAPSSGNAYFTNNYNLLTDISTANFVFGGKSLTVGPGVGLFVIRTTGTVTVADLRLKNGGVQNWIGGTPTLAGKILLPDATEYGQISPSQGRNLKISAVIDGMGQLRVKAGKVILTTMNTYTGGTVVQTDATYGSGIEAQAELALGSGDVVLQSGTTLKLSGGATNNYLADGAALSLASGLAAGSVLLDYTGADRIDGLSLDGGTTWLGNGTWGAPGSSATHQNPVFAGTGLLQVGPPAVVVNSLGETFDYGWTDTFSTLDTSRWMPAGAAGATVSGGNLVLTTYPNGYDDEGNQTFAYGRLESVDTYRYGRYEAIIYTDTQPGSCNAFYTVKGSVVDMKKVEWNEIDIVELMTDKTPAQNLIWEQNGDSAWSNNITPNTPDGWHMFAMEWTPNNISFYVDGKLVLVKPSDSFNNGPSRMMYAQEIHFSNWMPEVAKFDPLNPLSQMLVDKFTYYPLRKDTRTAAGISGSQGVTVSGGVISGLDEGGDYIRYNSVNTTLNRNITIEVASNHPANLNYLTAPTPPAVAPKQWWIEVRSGSATGGIIATLPVPYTYAFGSDDYDRFRQVSADLPNVGTKDLFLTFTDNVTGSAGTGCGSIREVHFHGEKPKSNARRTLIHAKNYDEKSGPMVFSYEDYVGTLNGGSTLRYRDIDFTGLTKITLEISNKDSAGKVIELWTSSRTDTAPTSPMAIGSITVPLSGAWRAYQQVDVSISGVSGIKDLWVKFPTASGTAGNLRSLSFPR